MLSKAKKYRITNEKIASYFGYASLGAFQSSSARKRIQKGVDRLVQDIEEEIHARLQVVLDELKKK